MGTVSGIFRIDESGNVFPPESILVWIGSDGPEDTRFIANDRPVPSQAGVYPVREQNVKIDARTVQKMRTDKEIMFARCSDEKCKFVAPGGFSIVHPSVETYDEGGWNQMAGIFTSNRAHFGTELYHMEHNASHGTATTPNSMCKIGVVIMP